MRIQCVGAIQNLSLTSSPRVITTNIVYLTNSTDTKIGGDDSVCRDRMREFPFLPYKVMTIKKKISILKIIP